MSRADDIWGEVHVGLPDHPKTARLRRRLGVSLPTVIGYLVLLWMWALRYAPNGDLSRFDPDVLADAAGWEDDPGVFVRALVMAGFVDESMQIHDWHDYAGRLIERREANAERMRRARRARVNGALFEHAAPDETSTSGARAVHVQGLPDLTGPDLTGPDRTPPPNPPPHGGGGPGLTPATDADCDLWQRAAEDAAADLTRGNAGIVLALEPLGRGPDGGLRLRAPPELGDVARFAGLVRSALVGAGDQAGGAAVIVTQ